MTRVSVEPVSGIAEVAAGDVLGELIAGQAALQGGEIVAISQKVVSKAEGRLVELTSVAPGARAVELADRCGKDPRVVELILSESRAILRAERGVIIAETHSGLICANAGIDASNLPGAGTVALLPRDPDRSARRIRAELAAPRTAVLITDSFGRPWRLGQAEVAIGAAGIDPLDDWRGRPDSSGRELTATAIAIADQIAAAADLSRTKTSGTPATIVRGLERHVTEADGPGASALLRPEDQDLFR